jgi:hypothetical protein
LGPILGTTVDSEEIHTPESLCAAFSCVSESKGTAFRGMGYDRADCIVERPIALSEVHTVICGRFSIQQAFFSSMRWHFFFVGLEFLCFGVCFFGLT